MKSIKNASFQLNLLINYYGSIKDNELFLINYNNFNSILNKEYNNFYFPLLKVNIT